METPTLPAPLPPPPENGHPANRSPESGHPANRSPENRFTRPPSDRPPPPLPEARQETQAGAAVNRSPEQRIQKVPDSRTEIPRLPESWSREQRVQKLPENRTPSIRLPDSRSPDKYMTSEEDGPTDRDDLALSPSPVAVAVAVANRSNREELRSVTKIEGGGMDRSSRVVPSIIRRSKLEDTVMKADLGFRVLGLIFCLISFSVMASDKTEGWSGDSFDRYKEYRYLLSMTVIGFVYAGFQAYAQGHYLITGKRFIQNPVHRYFDFFLDQILAYLLMSASSSAATRTNSWVTTWGEDDFTKVASASIGMSFLAFVAFAFSALISSYHLFKQKV